MNEKTNESENNIFQIHQGSYLNARLNKLLEDIDKFSLFPLTLNKDYGIINARLLLRTIASVGVTIYGEINKEEKEIIQKGIEYFEEQDFSNLFKDDVNFRNEYSGKKLDNKNWIELNSKILEFRLYLSELLEKYGLGISFEKNAKQEMLE